MSEGKNKVRFNRHDMVIGQRIDVPDDASVRNTLGLVNASAEDAMRYGGEVTRAALNAMRLRNDRRYVVVDVKVHMLMPGMCPAIPGWHTDGAPRSDDGSPQGDSPPNLAMQEQFDAMGRTPRYHLLTTGAGCLTEFFTAPFEAELPPEPTSKLYALLTQQVDPLRQSNEYYRRQFVSTPSCTVVEWDWWNIHQGVIATRREWRYLIRVTETDFLAPDTDLRRVIRTQQQVYAPLAFGW